MKNQFTNNTKHIILLAAFLIGISHVWGQTASKTPDLSTIDQSKNIRGNDEPENLWQNEPFGKYSQAKELPDKRDAFSKHFVNESGSITAYIAAGPINYMENGQWKTIFHTIVPSAGGFENLTNSHKTYYPATCAEPIKTILPNGATLKDMLGMRMYYEVNGQEVQEQNIQSKPGSVKFNELIYNAIYGAGIDLKLTQNTTQRKMDYIIQSEAALGGIPAGAEFLVFEESAELPAGWKAEVKDNVIYLADAAGKVQAWYEKPVLRDAPVKHNHPADGATSENKSSRSEIKTLGSYKIIQNSNRLTIKTLVPLSWLNSPERNFPVIIDPSVTCYPDNTANWTGTTETDSYPVFNYASTNITDYWGDDLVLGHFDEGYIYHSWIKFNITSVPDNTLSINSASMNYEVFNSYTGQTACVLDVNIRHMSTDPSVAFNVTNNPIRLADTRDGNIYRSVSFSGVDGPKTVSLTANLSDIIAQLAANYFSVGLHTYNTNPAHYVTEYIYIQGYSSASKPSLVIDYTICTAPTAYTVSGGGSRCADAAALTISLSGSQANVSYQLYNITTSTAVSTQAGTGSGLSWTGLTAAGTYKVIATGTGGTICTTPSVDMSGTPVITVNPTPAAPGAITGSSTVACQGTVTLTSALAPTGGTITTTGGNRIHRFTALGAAIFDVPVGFSGYVNTLVIAGGGGGGGFGGGGGAGGYKSNTAFLVNADQSVTVGDGGAGAAYNTGTAGSVGQNSVFGTITSTGGGGGGTRLCGSPCAGYAGTSGGSGGGGSPSDGATLGTGGSASPAGQGNAGGTEVAYGWGGSGGGGASAAGTGGSGNTGGAGGAGISNSITGAAVTYAGGGGGCSYNANGAAGAGGSGGGGNGSGGPGTTGVAGFAGTANTGGGGGGGDAGYSGGKGGSGVVIVSYPDVTAGVWSIIAGTGTASLQGATTVNTSGGIPVSSSQVIKGETAGTVTVRYTLTQGSCTSVTDFTLTVGTCCTPPTSGGTIASNQFICPGGTPVQITSTALPSGHTGSTTLEYKWQYSTDSNFSVPGNIVDIAGAASPDYTPASNLPRYYRRLARGCTATWDVISNIVSVTVNQNPTINTITPP